MCVWGGGGSSSAGGYSSVKSCDGFSIALHLATHRPSLIPDKLLNCSKMRVPQGGVVMLPCQCTMRCVCARGLKGESNKAGSCHGNQGRG